MQASFLMKNPADAMRLFADMPCLRGMALAALSGMGRVWTDRPLRPNCAVATVGDFILCAGEPGLSTAHMLRVAISSDDREWLMYGPGHWQDALAKVTDFSMETRYAFRHDVQPDMDCVRRLSALPEGITARPIEGPWIDACRQEVWSRDFVREFGDTFAEKGLGILMMQDGIPVAGASSYVAYPGGIEVQVQTRDGCEGRGLATAASARLIMAARERDLRVSWDAANPASARIAAKLGFVPAGRYDIAIIKK